jgi:hypothetical protein
MIGIAYTMIKEILLGFVGKIAFKAILERFFTRLVIYGLEKLAQMNTNKVVTETVEDIINDLKGKDLKVVEDL